MQLHVETEAQFCFKTMTSYRLKENRATEFRWGTTKVEHHLGIYGHL